MGPLAQKVHDAMYIGGEDGAIAASFNEPPGLAYDDCSSRDAWIKQWGLCVGVAFALAFAEDPFAGAEAAIQRAQDAAREAFYARNPELAAAEGVSV